MFGRSLSFYIYIFSSLLRVFFEMARRISAFVRKMVSELKNLTDRSDEEEEVREGETGEEEGAADGWDGASPEWQSWTEQEGGAGWDSSASTLPGDEEWAKLWTAAGFDGPGSSESKSSTEQESETGWDSSAADLPSETLIIPSPKPPSADEIKYSKLPFRTRHYFLTYVQRVLEDSCLRYARKHLSTKLSDPVWKKGSLNFPSREYSEDRLVFRDWLAEDEIELEFWLRMFGDCNAVPGRGVSSAILTGALRLRHATVHRADREELPFNEIFDAMKLPACLGDTEGESDISAAFKYVISDPVPDDEASARVAEAMYEPRPCTTRWHLLGRIQTFLEQSCFKYASSKIPKFLTSKKWTMPEQVELQMWEDPYWTYFIEQHDSAKAVFPGLDSGDLRSLLGNAREKIRNTVAHRNPMEDTKVITQVHHAITICILQNDWEHALETEVLAEMFFTQQTRPEVLKRLEEAYRDGPIECIYERERRAAIARFIAKEVEGRELSKEELTAVTGTPDKEFPDSSGTPYAKLTWSPSMHESLKRLEEL